MRIRCAWAGTAPLLVRYHDTEWGLPLHDDRRLFEFLVLEGAQAGLSWITDAAEMVFITTPDAVIPQIAAQVKWHPGQSVVHCSGADSLDVLTPATRSGALTGGFHPLQTFASITHAIENIPGSTFALEAEEPLLSTLREMAVALDGRWIALRPGGKVLYHAAAVYACIYLVTLVKMAADLWQTFGASAPQAVEALLPLLRGTANNLQNVGLPNCLTGPIARGDSGTIEKHIGALKARAPQLRKRRRSTCNPFCTVGSILAFTTKRWMPKTGSLRTTRRMWNVMSAT